MSILPKKNQKKKNKKEKDCEILVEYVMHYLPLVSNRGCVNVPVTMTIMLMVIAMLKQTEKQKLDAVSQCQKTAAERDEAVQGNKFLQSKLKEAEIALKELGQNVTVPSF